MSESRSSRQIVLAGHFADVGVGRTALCEHAVDCLHGIGDHEEALSFTPKRDGNEILKYLRASERRAQTPVVGLTSSDAPPEHENAEKNAAIHYFRKPSLLGTFLDLGLIIKGAHRSCACWLATLSSHRPA
jgi:hypothetical protein